MPSKCLATTTCSVGPIAPTMAEIASRNHDIGSKPIVMFKASLMIPKAANRGLRSVTTPPATGNSNICTKKTTAAKTAEGGMKERLRPTISYKLVQAILKYEF